MDDPSVPSSSGHTIASEVSRPAPKVPAPDRVRAWIDWFGVGRLIAASSAVVIVCAGGYWMIRTPPPPTEAGLPRSTTSTTQAVPTVDAGSSGTATSGSGIATGVPVSVTVHVAGAVVAPGVYTLPAEARVHHAVDAAGGVTVDADPDALNLAGPVVDGSRVYVPRHGEDVPVQATPQAVEPGPVDVNRATADQLDELPGVGPATAAAIVGERERNGPFTSVDDLERVPGIGPAKLAGLRDLVTT